MILHFRDSGNKAWSYHDITSCLCPPSVSCMPPPPYPIMPSALSVHRVCRRPWRRRPGFIRANVNVSQLPLEENLAATVFFFFWFFFCTSSLAALRRRWNYFWQIRLQVRSVKKGILSGLWDWKHYTSQIVLRDFDNEPNHVTDGRVFSKLHDVRNERRRFCCKELNLFGVSPARYQNKSCSSASHFHLPEEDGFPLNRSVSFGWTEKPCWRILVLWKFHAPPFFFLKTSDQASKMSSPFQRPD